MRMESTGDIQTRIEGREKEQFALYDVDNVLCIHKSGLTLSKIHTQNVVGKLTNPRVFPSSQCGRHTSPQHQQVCTVYRAKISSIMVNGNR